MEKLFFDFTRRRTHTSHVNREPRAGMREVEERNPLWPARMCHADFFAVKTEKTTHERTGDVFAYRIQSTCVRACADACSTGGKNQLFRGSAHAPGVYIIVVAAADVANGNKH